MKKLDQETKNIYLDSILLPLRKLLFRKVKFYAAHIGVPPVWIMQMLQSNLNRKSADVSSAVRLSCAMMLHDVPAQLNAYAEMGVFREAMDMMDEASAEMMGIPPGYLIENRGRMKNYYDFYAAVAFPEMLAIPEDWLTSAGIAFAESDAQSAAPSSGEESMTRAEFRAYVWRSVPEEMRAVVFNLAA